MSVAKSYIRSVAAGRCPPSDPKGQPCFGEDPSYLVIGSYDGSTAMVDLRDPAFTVELNRARSELFVSDPWTGIDGIRYGLGGRLGIAVWLASLRGRGLCHSDAEAPRQRRRTRVLRRAASWSGLGGYFDAERCLSLTSLALLRISPRQTTIPWRSAAEATARSFCPTSDAGFDVDVERYATCPPTALTDV